MVEISAISNPSLFFRDVSKEELDDKAANIQANTTAVQTIENANKTVNAKEKSSDVGNKNAFSSLSTLAQSGSKSTSSSTKNSSSEKSDDKAEKSAEKKETEKANEAVPGSFSKGSIEGLAGGGAVSPQTAKQISRSGVPASVQAKVNQISSDRSHENSEEFLKEATQVKEEGKSVPNEGTQLVPPGTHFSVDV